MGAAGGFWSGIGQEDVQVGAFRSEHDAEDHSPPEDQLGSRPHQAERHSHAELRMYRTTRAGARGPQLAGVCLNNGGTGLV